LAPGWAGPMDSYLAASMEEMTECRKGSYLVPSWVDRRGPDWATSKEEMKEIWTQMDLTWFPVVHDCEAYYCSAYWLEHLPPESVIKQPTEKCSSLIFIGYRSD
jgi:hypothetical protein